MSITTAPVTQVTLETADQQLFTVERELLVQSSTISEMLTEMDQKGKYSSIQLKDISSTTFSKVLEWCTLHKGEEFVADEDNREKRCEEISESDEEFMKMDEDQAFQLLIAANYLNLKGLLDLCCKVMARQLNGKSPEEIRRFFNVSVDLESERKLRERESAWAHD